VTQNYSQQIKRINDMARRVLGITASLLIFFSGESALAQSEQLYFAAIESQYASLSPGSKQTAVYLRWDAVEGGVPSDLADFKIKRDGVLIGGALSAQSVLTPAQIASLYTGMFQARRAAEIQSALHEEATGRLFQAAEDGITAPSCLVHPVTASNFPTAIVSKIDPLSPCHDNYWAVMASRLDFNVARARNRGFVDTTVVGSGNFTYELIGVSTENAETLLGRIVVEVDGIPDRLPVAGGFEQRETARCDAPEKHKDHGSVSLFWDYSGSTLTDRVRDALLTTGYDLYRSTTDPDGLTNLDLASLAANLKHTADGSLDFPGLERVNVRPIAISGAPDPGSDGIERETRNLGWNAPFVQYVEPPEALAAANVQPGDKRNYYLVARDFSGNYGETAEIIVTVPDLVAPPAPWDFRTVRDSAYENPGPDLGGSFELVWDHVDARNYYADHTHAHNYCNLATARFDKKLIYAPGEADCSGPDNQEVDLDVEKYIVYRFDSPEAAKAFVDSDGDGRGDLVERTALPGPPSGLTTPGTACDDQAFPPAAQDYRAAVETGVFEIDLDAGPSANADWSFTTAADGRRQIRWRDTDPQGPAGIGQMAIGGVFWYAVVTVDADRNFSPLSAPVRAFFPDRTRPNRGDIICGKRECALRADHLATADASLPFAEDRTPGALADFIRVGCSNPFTGSTFEVERPIVTLPDGKRGVDAASIDCGQLVENCSGSESYVEFHSNDGTLLDASSEPYSALYPTGFNSYPTPLNSCPIENAYLEESCRDRRLISIQPGETLVEAPVCEPAPEAPKACISVYRRLGDKSFKWKTHCEPTPLKLDVNSSGGDSICLSVALQNENNVLSAPVYLPCFSLLGKTAIAPPQPIAMTFGPDEASLEWLPPEQSVVGTLLQWRRTDDNSGGAHFFPHAGITAQDGPRTFGGVDLGSSLNPNDASQEWCFKARSIGGETTSGSSEWSAELCSLRLPPGQVYPVYLPWPAIPTPGNIENLSATYLPLEGLPAVLIGEFTTGNQELVSGLPTTCLGTDSNGNDPPCIAAVLSSTEVNFCANIRATVAPRLGFVAYRQSRKDSLDSQPTEFHQVSPLVDRVHCWNEVQGSAAGIPAIKGTLEDPFIELVHFHSSAWNEQFLIWTDRSPHEVGLEYRYQLVYFTDRGEILGDRTTGWVASRETNQ